MSGWVQTPLLAHGNPETDISPALVNTSVCAIINNWPDYYNSYVNILRTNNIRVNPMFSSVVEWSQPIFVEA